jgi:mRNA-degrading endonuclease toxin of MazEF toxin-antitoxin module
VIEAGDIHLADVNQERRLHVLVVSSSKFTRLSGRVIVAPAVPGGGPDEMPFPWRIDAEGHVFAIDLLRSIPADRLLEHAGRVTPSVAASVQRVTRHIL